jgi:hypothetical protein
MDLGKDPDPHSNFHYLRSTNLGSALASHMPIYLDGKPVGVGNTHYHSRKFLRGMVGTHFRIKLEYNLDLSDTSIKLRRKNCGLDYPISTPFSSLIRTVMPATSASSVSSPSNRFGKDLILISAPSFQPKSNRPTVPYCISTCSTTSAPAPTITISIASSLMFWLRQEIIVTIMCLLCAGGVVGGASAFRRYLLHWKALEEASTPSPQLTDTIITSMDTIDGWVARGFN